MIILTILQIYKYFTYLEYLYINLIICNFTTPLPLKIMDDLDELLN